MRLIKTVDHLEPNFSLKEVAAFVLGKETEEQMNMCLSHLKFEKYAVFKGDVQSAIQKYSKIPSPSLLIVDISRSELPLSDLENLANVCAPNVKVVVIGVRDTVGLYRSLLNYGVTDYLVKPLPVDLLARTLKKLQSDEDSSNISQKIGTVVGVYGSCGGLGSTSLTCSIADILAREMHRRIMLVDLNLCQSDIGFQFGMKPGNGLSDLLTKPERVDNFILERAAVSVNERLDLLCTEDDVGNAASVSPSSVATLTSRLRRDYHFVMLDIMRGPTLNGIEILNETDIRLVILNQSIGSLRNTKNVLDYLNAERDGKRNVLILNQNKPPSKADISLQNIEQFLEQTIDCSIPYDGRNFAAATLNAQPVSQLGGSAVHHIRKLSQRLAGSGEEYKQDLQHNIMGEKDVWEKIIEFGNRFSRRGR